MTDGTKLFLGYAAVVTVILILFFIAYLLWTYVSTILGLAVVILIGWAGQGLADGANIK